MNVTFEPGDGSFCVILHGSERVPSEWSDCSAATIYRQRSDGFLELVKRQGEHMNVIAYCDKCAVMERRTSHILWRMGWTRIAENRWLCPKHHA